MNSQELLREVSFGSRVAEEESARLRSYFVQTNDWKRVYSGEVDVVYGPKGSGKSAIYSLLQDSTAELFDKSILYIPGENPRGATAFKELVADPPTTEMEFQDLWKLYFSSLIAGVFSEFDIKGKQSEQLSSGLRDRGLLVGSESLSEKFKKAFDYVRSIRPTSLEAGVKVDQYTGLPTGVVAKVGFDGSDAAEKLGNTSPDVLLKLANDAVKGSGFRVWLAIDRLDVAFQENDVLEANALRALFKVYLDLLVHGNLRLMIFLRTDIWKKITESGFREASHITRALTITWSRDALLNLILRRLLQSDQVATVYAVDSKAVLADQALQETLFYRVFPSQIDVGEKKPSTLEWILSRTRDGTGNQAPRELIHLLNEAREIQIQKYTVGGEKPEGSNLFSRSVIKEALRPVSKVRLEQTLYAEYPSLKTLIQKLEKEKATQRLDSLSKIWKNQVEEAHSSAEKLADIGFFERRGTKQAPAYWVPFLYRDALDLVQGEAE